MVKKELIYATGNKGKFESVAKFFERLPAFEVKQFSGELSEEQTLDQEAIAIAKAKQAWHLVQKPLLVDDIGIYFNQYNQFPGTMTKFVYQALGFEGIYKLVQEGDKASFIIYLVYIWGPNEYKVFTHESIGHIIKPAHLITDSHVPFEYIFVPEGYDKSYIELKHTGEYYDINCRMQALKKFIEFVE